jgi:Ca2+-transporting ATPase
MKAPDWSTLSAAAVLDYWQSTPAGLAVETARRRLAAHGFNELPEARPDSYFQILLRQFASPLIYLLLIAAGVVWWLGEAADSLIIAAVLALNAVIGTIQEGRAQSTLLALRRFVATRAVVVRGGGEVVVPDRELVPGDVIILKDGDRVPADARLIELTSLLVDEAALTGESEAVAKQLKPLARPTALPAERLNMVFRGTLVLGGSGVAVVVATGVHTLIGQVSARLEKLNTEMPLHASIRRLSRLIIVAVLGISALLFVLGVSIGTAPREMFAIVVAVAVSAIPEGLPVVVTLVLATGVARMSRRQALVRRLLAVEALGQARVIAVDKTGTVTKNQMMVTAAYVGGRMLAVTGSGYEPRGTVLEEGKRVDGAKLPGLNLLGRIAALTANAGVAYDEERADWQRLHGDPTEAALLVFGQKLGLERAALEESFLPLAEILFDSKIKYHASLNAVAATPGAKALLSVSGAPEVVLAAATSLWHNGRTKKLTRVERKRLEEIQAEMMSDGLRVLALAVSAKRPADRIEPGILPPLIFVGFVGIMDALRPEVAAAVTAAKGAGIRVVMITGDHVETAKAIARTAGIYRPGDWTITGAELETMSPKEVAARLDRATVFARVTPEHKLKIIEGYKFRGEVVAMTGDGVNDALSLAAADLGVAMGKTGTEVAKEAADIVLLDDNFGNIIAAVEEGRNIYQTIKKVVLYLFSTSLGEVLTITGAILLGFPVPLTAGQIIWLNFVTDGFLVVALAFEATERGLLGARFKFSGRSLLDHLSAWRMFVMSAVMTVGTLVLFAAYQNGPDVLKAGTVALTALAVFQWFNAWNCRSATDSVFQPKARLNWALVGATGAVFLLQLAAVYLPFFQKFLRTVPLALGDWLLIISLASSILVVEELRKGVSNLGLFSRQGRHPRPATVLT